MRPRPPPAAAGGWGQLGRENSTADVGWYCRLCEGAHWAELSECEGGCGVQGEVWHERACERVGE